MTARHDQLLGVLRATVGPAIALKATGVSFTPVDYRMRRGALGADRGFTGWLWPAEAREVWDAAAAGERVTLVELDRAAWFPR